MSPALWTPQEARLYLGIPLTSFWRLVHDKRVPRVQYSARLVRFDPAVIKALRAAHEVRTPADVDRLADGRRSWMKTEKRRGAA